MQFTSIQILRAVAAILVVLNHVRVYLVVLDNKTDSIFSVLPNMLTFGALMFFIISGFLMAYLIDSDYKNFLVRRLARIYPTYILAAILTIFFKVMAIGSVSYPNLLKSISLLPVGAIEYPLNVEWSLIYEIFFYIICSFFTISNFKRYFPYFLIVWMIIILTATLKYHIKISALPTLDVIFIQLNNLYFIFGALTYYINKHFSSISQKTAYILMSPWVFLFVCFTYLSKFPEFLREYYYLFAISCVLLLIGALSLKNNYSFKPLALIIKMGDYSYALYLVHVPIVVIIYTLYKQYVGSLDSYVAVFALIACLLSGWWFGKLDVFLHKYTKNKLTKIIK